jgi:hypothetical protein
LRQKIKMGTVMENRKRFLMAANALLYFGPLLAGLGGFGWGLVVVFTVIFVLWLIILQPMEFPINRAEWLSFDAWVAVSARAAVQLLLVVILFGVGRGIGGILGAIPAFPVMLPLAISFLSIPLARMIWDPWAQPPAPPAAAPNPAPPAEAAPPTPPAAPDTTKPN